MKVRRWIAAAGLAWLSTPVFGQFKAADFLEADQRFQSGYAFGVIESLTGFHNPTYADAQVRWSRCLIDGGIDSGELRAAVVRYIEQNPSTLVEPAYGAITQALNAMCP